MSTSASAHDDAFGGSGYRDRFTDAVWQGPTWSFAIVLGVLGLQVTPAGGPMTLLVAGLVLVMVVTVLAVLVHWERVPAWTQVLLPVGDLVGAALMVLAVPARATSAALLLLSLPVIWLAFEFGRRGTALGIAAVAGIAVAAQLVHRDDLRPAEQVAELVVPALFLVGLAVVARLMAGILARIGDTLRSQTHQLAHALDLAESRLVVLEGVMETIPAGIAVVGPDRPPMYNARAVSLAARADLDRDHPRHAARSLYLDDGTTPVPTAEQPMVRALAGEEFTGVVHWLGEPGEQVAGVSSARQLVREDGEVLGTVMVTWDATELMHAIRVREDFVTTVSHELRTPLTAISSSLELLTQIVDDDALDPDVAVLLSSSVRNSALLGARITELMASTASTGDGRVVHACSTDVADLVRVSLAKHHAAVAHAGLVMHADLHAPLVAELDPTRFEQVVDNLVSNAVKYTTDGAITVSLRPGADSLVLSVADSGVGMTRDEVRQACHRFYRAPAAKATAVKGLGIGLDLVKSIVESHRGAIEIDSEPGVGTTVTVSIPLAVAQDVA